MARDGSRGWGWPWSAFSLVIGLAALAFGAVQLGADAVEASRSSQPIDATVTQVDYASGTGMSKRYFPTVTYVVDGAAYEEATENHRGTEPAIGSTVSVTYDTADPRRVSLTGASGGGGADWSGSIILLVGGVGLISAAVAFSPAVRSRRR
ncbi:DUF3592 domain-containing protein [Microbacterium sp. ZW T5_56]|uniref:DUF3592 domain-containing protein n=1 Tax=Microbacterium sp. ZW T5_56 TaxID=3378081 RepID=UPI003854E3CB